VVGIACGVAVSWWGHYAPFIVVGSAIFTVGAGLLTLFNVTLPSWQAYGFMIVVGSGYGLSLQNAYIAVQVVLPIETLPVGNAIVMFSQTFSYVPKKVGESLFPRFLLVACQILTQFTGAIFVAVAQSVLSNGLVNGMSAKIPILDPSGIISAGATGIRNIVPPDLLPLVLTVYDETMKHFYYCRRSGGVFVYHVFVFRMEKYEGEQCGDGMIRRNSVR
jgi:hypothetical protein